MSNYRPTLKTVREKVLGGRGPLFAVDEVEVLLGHLVDRDAALVALAEARDKLLDALAQATVCIPGYGMECCPGSEHRHSTQAEYAALEKLARVGHDHAPAIAAARKNHGE